MKTNDKNLEHNVWDISVNNTDSGIPMFSLEDFMKSITYAPKGMSHNLARAEIEAENDYTCAPDREALILERALSILPIGIHREDLIAGNYGLKFAGDEYVKKVTDADAREFGESPEYKVRDEEERIISGKYLLFGIYTPSHTCVDYETILKKGLKYYKVLTEQAMESADAYGKDYCNAMIKSIATAQMFAGRYKKLADSLYDAETQEKRRIELGRMRKALKRVPYEPAADLFEALQSIWIVHTILPASERSWASVSLGRMDQFLWPYYDQWLSDGNKRDEAKELFKNFFLLLDSYGDGSGTLNLGSDWNALSELLLEVEKEVKYRAPIIAVRMTENTSHDIYDKFIDKTLFEIGQPTFYSEDNCLKAMAYRGMSPKEDFAVNSCMGNVVAGDELADMWGCCVNMNLPLELAVNMGRPLHGELPASLTEFIDVTAKEPENMETILSQYALYLDCVVQYVTSQNLRRAAWTALNRPNPFLSVITNDCPKYGRDRAHSAVHALGAKAYELLGDKDRSRYEFSELARGRGAKYHNVTVLAMGYAHAADSLTAIGKLVFGDHKYPLNDLIAAAADNYSGKEKNREILAALRHCDKYGEGKRNADKNAVFVLDALADACEKAYSGNIRFLPTCHTIDANIQFGSCVYASLDGRMDGEAFAKNAGAAMWAIKSDPSGLMLSSAMLPQERYSGGVPIDIYVPENILSSRENAAKFRALLRTYFQSGGKQVQVNSVSLDLLKKAYENPEQYPHVIVRKGGFSIYFTDMFKCVQKDMIERLAMEQRT
jgi:pyruvate-formate lyase